MHGLTAKRALFRVWIKTVLAPQMMANDKGFGFQLDREKILLYKDNTATDKLLWLEEANRFCQKFVTGKRRKIWEKIRRGEL